MAVLLDDSGSTVLFAASAKLLLYSIHTIKSINLCILNAA